MARKFIFDVDGTLTPSRDKIDPEFKKFFQRFVTKHDVYLVTGGSKEHTVEQVGPIIWTLVRRAYQCSGNLVYEGDKIIRQNTIELTSEMQEFFDHWLDASQFEYRTGQHIDVRPGLINFSTIGRNCTREQRDEYVAYDSKVGERELIAKLFNEEFGPNLVAQVAGQTGLDIIEFGNDKSQIIVDFYPGDEMHFFGDKMDEGGNDYPLAVTVENVGGKTYHVKDWKETWNILKEL